MRLRWIGGGTERVVAGGGYDRAGLGEEEVSGEGGEGVEEES